MTRGAKFLSIVGRLTFNGHGSHMDTSVRRNLRLREEKNCIRPSSSEDGIVSYGPILYRKLEEKHFAICHVPCAFMNDLGLLFDRE